MNVLLNIARASVRLDVLARGWIIGAMAAVCVFASIPRASAQVNGADGTPPTVLTNAQQILALSNNIPAGLYQARFQAVVIYISPTSKRLYVQDGDLGVQLNLTGSVAAYRVGNLVEASGTVLGGDPSLRLTKATATVLGDAPLPEPKLFAIHYLVRGDHPYRYVKVRGVVRDMFSNRSGMTLLLTQDNYPFEVALPLANAPLPRDWTDAEIEVTGHSFPFYHPVTGRPTGLRFHASSTNDIRILKPGLADRFEGRPLLTLAEAAKLPNDLKPRHRVSGTVTFHRPGNVLFLDDGTGVLHVDNNLRLLNAPADAQRLEREPQTRLQPGERIEVIGARCNFFSVAPSFQAIEYRRIGKGEPIKPIAATLQDLINGRHAGRLVTLRAQLIDHRIWGNAGLRHQMTATLRNENDIFQAQWEGDAPVEWNLQDDGYVQITGVNDAETSPNRKRNTFKFLLRSPADIVPAEPPPFWVRQEFQRLALAMGGVALLAGAWIALQRWQLRRLERRVAERTAELSGANALLQDEVAARQRAEAEVQRALAHERELSELKSRFVSMVSHEFRTPLGIIMSSAEILDAYLDRLPPEERRSNLRDITQSSKHMAAMMEEVLLLGRVEAGKMACNPGPLDLGVLCAKLADEVTSATSARCGIELIVPPDLGEANADESLLRHILTNLLGNAVKYSPAGATVHLAVEAREHLALFFVRDRGIGIPEADQRQIFQAFHRGRNVGEVPGTGLGMVIVKHCVQLHGGKIAFESREGAGTTFTVALPLFARSPGSNESTTQLFRASTGPGQITISS